MPIFILGDTKILNSQYDRCIYIKIKPNTAYTVRKIVQSTTSFNRFGLMTTTDIPAVGVTYNKSVYNRDGSTKTSETIVTGPNDNYLVAFVYTANNNEELSFEDMLNSIKIQKGNKATPYSEYGKGTIEIKQTTKNLLNLNGLATQTINGVTFTPIYKNGLLQHIIANGTATANAEMPLGDIELEGGIKYKYVGCPGIGSASTYAWGISGVNLEIGSGMAFTPTNTMFYKAFIRIYKGYTANNLLFKPMISTDTTITYDDYEPGLSTAHILQTKPLRSLPNGVRDELRTTNSESIILNGSENWQDWTGWESEEYIGFILDGINYNNSKGSDIRGMSEQFKIGPTPNSTCENIGFRQLGDTTQRWYICIKRSELSSEDILGLKQYLQQNPIEVQYELAEPTIEPFELPKMSSFKGTTDITTTNEIKPTLNVTYYKDLSTQNKELEDRVQAIEEMLSTTQTSVMLLDNMQNDLEKEVEEI